MSSMRVLFAMGLLSYGAMASADAGLSLRAGTLGIGADVNVGLTEKLNLRVGYSLYEHEDTLEDTDIVYDAELSLSNATALLDYHVFGGGFRLTFGAVGASTEVDVVGSPTRGSYDIGDRTFLASEVGSLTGKIEMGNSVAPYLGFGWGNTVDKAGRITFLFDIGAVYTGSPEVDLNAVCGATTVSRCNLLQQEVQIEEDELTEDATEFEWYPAIGLGLAIRF
jgi:hypothetical protein